MVLGCCFCTERKLDAIEIKPEDVEEGKEIARGISNYASTETRRIKRQPSSEIVAILGYVEESELIHRDNLVLL